MSKTTGAYVNAGIIRGMQILRHGVYQLREAGNARGWEREFTPQSHRDVAEARAWLNKQAKGQGVAS